MILIIFITCVRSFPGTGESEAVIVELGELLLGNKFNPVHLFVQLSTLAAPGG